tara:strand:+ start:18087 stop:18869 length:783 start_codon:yes stop_codon:yes gene_type:complete
MTVNRSRDRGYWVWYLRTGDLRLRYGAQTISVQPGQWLFLPEGYTSHEFSSGAELLSIHFRCQWLTGDNLIHIEQPIVLEAEMHPNLLKSAATLECFLRQKFPSVQSHATFHREQANYSNFLQLQVYFYAWLKEWIALMQNADGNWTYNKSEDERILSACRILNQSPPIQGIPNNKLAKATGLSRVQLNRLFSRELGFTVSKYWDKRLLQQARSSLKGPDCTVKELAYSLGFGSDSLFVNWFRRRQGQSPGRYRKSRQND